MILILWQSSAGAKWDSPDKGPLQIKIQSPPYLMFLTPVPDSPELAPFDKLAISMALDYSSTFLYAKSHEWFALIDMEMMVLDLFLEYRAAKNLSLMANLPMVGMGSGFMDPFLDDYHTRFNFREYGRSLRPQNAFDYNLKINDQDWIHSQHSGLRTADGSVSAKFMVLDDETTGFLCASISYFLKVPLGDTTRGLGSGHFDHGIFLLTRVRNFPFILYFNTGFILLSDPETFGPEVSVNNIFSFLISTEYVISKTCSFLLQLNCFESPFNDTGISKLDGGNIEMGLGLIWDIKPNFGLEVAFCEDLSETGTPDFNIHGRIFHHWGL